MLKFQNLSVKLKNNPLYIVLIFITLYTIYSSLCAIFRYYGLYYGAFDLGIYMQSLWTTLHGEGFFYTTLWEGSRFATHFEPILLFILPLYAILPHAETLLILQSLMIALGALPIYLIAKEDLGQRAGVAFAALYLLYPALHGVNQSEFHGSALAIPFLLFCFYMFRKKRYVWGMVFAILAMMCKENVPLVVIFMGLYWLWEERSKVKTNLGKQIFRERDLFFPAFLTLIGITWFFLSVYFIIPWFNQGENVLVGLYDFSLRSLFADPAIKIGYLVCLFLPLLFTSLLHPPTLLIGLPIFAQNLWIDDVGMYHIWSHHPSLLIPWVFIASIYGIKKLPEMKNKFIRRIYLKRPVSGRLFPVFITTSLVITVVMGFVIGPMIGRGINLITLPEDLPEMVSHQDTLHKAIELIDGPVYAQNALFTFVCYRKDAYYTLGDTYFFEGYRRNLLLDIVPWSDEVKEQGFDYILMDERTHDPLGSYYPIREYIMEATDEESIQRIETEYGLFAEGDGIYLYKWGYEGEPTLL